MSKKEQEIIENEEVKKTSEPDKTEKNTGQLQACQKELADLKDQFMRSAADFQNYKRRSDQERATWMLNAQSAVFKDLLAIVDDFDRAQEEHAKKERTPEMDAWLQGFEMIGKSLYKLLKKYDITPIKENKKFDPELHEALVQVDSDDHESGQIVSVLQKGFMIKDKLLRPAKVSVAK